MPVANRTTSQTTAPAASVASVVHGARAWKVASPGRYACAKRVGREEPERRRDAEPDEPDRDGIDAREVHHEHAERERGEQGDRRAGEPRMRDRMKSAAVPPEASSRRHAPMPTKPPTTKNSGMICAIQVTGPIQFVSRSVLLDDESAARNDRRADHEHVPDDDDGDAEHADEVHDGVTGGSTGHDGHRMRCAGLAHGPSDSALAGLPQVWHDHGREGAGNAGDTIRSARRPFTARSMLVALDWIVP